MVSGNESAQAGACVGCDRLGLIGLLGMRLAMWLARSGNPKIVPYKATLPVALLVLVEAPFNTPTKVWW